MVVQLISVPELHHRCLGLLLGVMLRDLLLPG
jgi:hypothetical protein